MQGIEVDESLNQVFGTTHVGEQMFASDGDCVPQPNAAPTVEKASGGNKGNGVGNQSEPPDAAEPHVHGVQINPLTGTVYVSDEGEEECFFESVTVLQPLYQ